MTNNCNRLTSDVMKKILAAWEGICTEIRDIYQAKNGAVLMDVDMDQTDYKEDFISGKKEAKVY